MSFWQFLVEHQAEIFQQTIEHIRLTAISLVIAITIGVGIGIILTRYPTMANKVIGLVGIIQTIPSVALLGFMLPLLGIGAMPAIIALFLYALLPIVRNTYTSIDEVEKSIIEAAKGMGMPDQQILFKVELPLAVPVIFAGIRTATVTTVGVATLCALIASGGLGVFIFRGLALNDINLILAGAIPAAALALFLDFFLGILQQKISHLTQNWLSWIVVIIALVLLLLPITIKPTSTALKAGFTSEFMERADGYPGLKKHYNLTLDPVELDPGLMYQAIRNKKVDIISGFSTDGRINAYDLVVLEDDLNYFPPYDAVPIVRNDTLNQYPQLVSAFDKLSGKLSEQKMTELNYRVDYLKEPVKDVARSFVQELEVSTTIEKNGVPDIILGSKNFTEQYILAHIMKVIIENSTSLDVELKTGLAGTKICFDALVNGDIDSYPEYTGTGLLVILKPNQKQQEQILKQPTKVLNFLRKETQKRYDLTWLKPLGFNNSYALMMRRQQAKKLGINSISDLKSY